MTCLCNTAKHLHWHLIPRYSSPREFQGVKFEDKNFGRNYAPYDKRKLDGSILMDIKDSIIFGLLE